MKSWQVGRLALLLAGAVAWPASALPLPAVPRLLAISPRPASEAPAVVGWAALNGFNGLLYPAAATTTAAAQAWRGAAQAAGLAFIARLETGAVPADLAPDGWLLSSVNSERLASLRTSVGETPLIVEVAAAPTVPLGEPRPDVVLYGANGLFQPGQSLSEWADTIGTWRAAFNGPVWATVHAAAPPWFSEQFGPAAAALAPQPAQLRLQAYAALGNGASGLVYEGLDPTASTGPGLMASLLNREVAAFSAQLGAGAAARVESVGEVRVGLRTGVPSTLALVWRDRGRDSCLVGGGIAEGLAIDLTYEPAPTQVHRWATDGWQPEALDQRAGGLRLPLGQLDLTEAYLLGQAEPPGGAPAVDPLLSAALEQRGLAIGQLAWLSGLLPRLPAPARADGTAVANLRAARALLREGGAALDLGYRRSALDMARESERLVRSAATIAYDALVADPGLAATQAERRLTLATMPMTTGQP